MWDDLKYAARRLRLSPAFTAIAVLTLAVAVGANTAILSIADGVLFRPLPYADADRVFILQSLSSRTGLLGSAVHGAFLRAIDAEHDGVGPVGRIGEFASAVSLDTAGAQFRLRALAVGGAYFDVLGVRPAAGRLFTEDDARGRSPVVLLSHAAWMQVFGRNPSVVGASIALGGNPYEIIGVLPEGFRFATGSGYVGDPDVVTLMPPIPPDADHGSSFSVVRLEPGVTREAAQAELDAISTRLQSRHPDLPRSTPYLAELRATMYPTGRPIMQFLLTAALLVLLLGCANLANMLLARGRRRVRETAVHVALGAGRVRVIRPVLFEAAFVGLTGSVLAVLTAALTFDWLLTQIPEVAYRNAPVGVDLRVASFGLALGLGGVLLFSLVPAWRTMRLDAQAVLQGAYGRDASRGRHTGGRPMVVAQVALAIVLVFGAAVAARAFIDIIRAPLGFNPDNVAMIVSPRPPSGEDSAAFYRRIIDPVARRGDVVRVGGISAPPLLNAIAWSGAQRPGTTDEVAGIVQVLPGYFETVEQPVIRGRSLTWDDMADQTPAVVSESAARALFGDTEPIGQSFGNSRGERWQVVGVVTDERISLTQDVQPRAYVLPGERLAARGMQIAVRMRARSAQNLESLRQELVASSGGPVPVGSWWSDEVAELAAIRNPRFQTLVLGSFAAIALGLTALGIFGVVAFLVAVRSKEMSIRVAIGADPRSLVRLMVRQALAPVGVGLAAGLLATRWLAGFAEAQLYDVDANDPVTLAGAAVTVVAAALVAAYIPARRASRVDPVTVLKAE